MLVLASPPYNTFEELDDFAWVFCGPDVSGLLFLVNHIAGWQGSFR